MSIKITLTKESFPVIRGVLGAFTGPESIVSNDLMEKASKYAESKEWKTVDQIEPFEVEVDQLQLASLKSGLLNLVSEKTTAGDLFTLLQIATEFKIRKTVEAAIRSKLPAELSADELDDLVELD